MKSRRLTNAQDMNLQTAMTQASGGLNMARRILSEAMPSDDEDESATGACPHCGKDLDVKPDEPKDDEPAKDEPADQAKEPAANAFGWGKAIARANAGQIVATKEA